MNRAAETRFEIVVDRRHAPEVIFDGGEPKTVPVRAAELAGVFAGTIDHDLPQTRRWRNYYEDSELNEIAGLLPFAYRFVLNREWAYVSALGQPVHLQAELCENLEYSICFCYDERSALHYTYWLVAILRRPLAEADFLRRIDDIKKHWL